MNKFYMMIGIMALAAGLSFGQPVCVQAGVGESGADYLVYVGELDLEKGRVNDALHEFKKALILDPSHKKAQHYLAQYTNDGNLSVGWGKKDEPRAMTPRSGVNQERVNRDIEKYLHSKISKLQAEKDRLSKAAKEKNRLAAQVKSLKESLAQKDRMNQEQLDRLARQYDKTTADLEKYYQSMQEVTVVESADAERLESELLALQEKNNQLREDNVHLRSREDRLAAELEDYVYIRHHELGRLEDQNLYQKVALARQQKEILTQLDQMISMNKSIGRYCDRLGTCEADLEQEHQELMNLYHELENTQTKVTTTETVTRKYHHQTVEEE